MISTLGRHLSRRHRIDLIFKDHPPSGTSKFKVCFLLTCLAGELQAYRAVAAAEERWKQQSGLVLMLPHGLEGQGPDHSSARIERFLQLCNDDPDHLPGNSPAQRWALYINVIVKVCWMLSLQTRTSSSAKTHSHCISPVPQFPVELMPPFKRPLTKSLRQNHLGKHGIQSM